MGFLTISHKYMIQQYFTVTTPHSVFSQYIKQIKRFENAGDNIKFTDFNTHCSPKIRLCGWQKASHFTLVLSKFHNMSDGSLGTQLNVYL